MPSFRRVLTVVAIVVIGLIALSRARPRKYNRLFLYAVRSDELPFGKAAVATISPDHFTIESEFTYGDWSFVTSAANGNNKWLFFHSLTTRSAAIGLIDDNFILRIKKFYGPGVLDFPYYSAVVDGRGYLLLNGYPENGKAIVGFAQVLEDDDHGATYVEWWRTELLDFPFPYGETIIGLKNAHMWYKNDPPPGGGSTVYIFDIKHAQILSSRQWDMPLDGMVADGDNIFLYFGDTQKSTELCVLNSSQQLVTIKRTVFDADFYKGSFDGIASTPGAHLLHPDNTFMAPGAIRVLSRSGFRLTKQVGDMDWLWNYYVQC